MSNRDMPNWTPRERDRLTQLIDAGHSYDVSARAQPSCTMVPPRPVS